MDSSCLFEQSSVLFGKKNQFNVIIALDKIQLVITGCQLKGALKRKSLNVEECGHEIRNEFHWSQKSRGTQAIIIAMQDRTSYVAVTYERTVSTAGFDAIPRLVQLLCGSTITRSVRDEELATWEERSGCAKRI